MAASIPALVEATKRRKAQSDKSVGWPLAAIKAIEGTGIRHKDDVRRLKNRVMDELRKDGSLGSSPSVRQ